MPRLPADAGQYPSGHQRIIAHSGHRLNQQRVMTPALLMLRDQLAIGLVASSPMA
jgi:hypothetical protein